MHDVELRVVAMSNRERLAERLLRKWREVSGSEYFAYGHARSRYLRHRFPFISHLLSAQLRTTGLADLRHFGTISLSTACTPSLIFVRRARSRLYAHNRQLPAVAQRQQAKCDAQRRSE